MYQIGEVVKESDKTFIVVNEKYLDGIELFVDIGDITDTFISKMSDLAESNPGKYGPAPSYSTVRRRMRALGLTKKSRPRRPKPGQIVAVDRLEKREVRSFEMTHVGALAHLDFHNGSLKVVDAAGGWHEPEVYASLDDYSRLCLHCQWYLEEETETLVHGFEQAIMKRGLMRALMSDRGAAMMSGAFQNGLRDLSIEHTPTLPYSAYQNADGCLCDGVCGQCDR